MMSRSWHILNSLTFAQYLVNVYHPIANRNTLRAKLFAVEALDTYRRPFLLGNPGVSTTCSVEFIVHNAFIVILQIAGNGNALGTGQTVFALGAINRAEFLILDADLIKKSQIGLWWQEVDAR